MIAPATLDRQSTAAVIVLYRPEAQARRVAAAAAPHVNRVYLVDNTPGGSALGAALAGEEGVSLIASGNNVGLGTAYNLAAAAAVEDGYRWLLVLDQDTILHDDYLAVMAQRLSGFPARSLEEIACAGPRYVHSLDPDKFLPDVPPCAEVSSVISSGSLVNLAIWEAVGGFDDTFFIDYVDVEYCLRARRNGYAVVEVGDLLMTHTMGAADVNTIFGFYSRKSSNYPPLRHYYMTRNAVVTGRTVGGAKWSRPELLMRLKVTALSVAMEPARWRILKAIAYGLRDGWHGTTGELPAKRRANLS